MIKILFFGDIFGRPGRQAIIKTLPKYKKKYHPDLTIANAENLAHGFGVTQKTITEMSEAGIDFFTSGNHIWDKQNVIEFIDDQNINLIRPANYPAKTPGQGAKLITINNQKILIINLIGQVFFTEEFLCPFNQATQIIKKYKTDKPQAIIIDFHAEATSEKVALGYYLDGQISALLGTHTHIQTADYQILENGTGYITDVGMTGAKPSVIGLDKDVIIDNFLKNETKSAPVPETNRAIINGIYLEINPKSGKCVKIEPINDIIDIE